MTLMRTILPQNIAGRSAYKMPTSIPTFCSFLLSIPLFRIFSRIDVNTKKTLPKVRSQRVDKPSHSVSVLRAGAHECQIRSAPVLGLPSLQRFSITLKRRQRAKTKFILALCQQSKTLPR
ncbi:hypothetical protein C883_3254 [Bacillus stratosphericus LAMA 585]|nr:hypothetical protein C883_3254 [Bacillus stratosphericus LAMA 585]